MATWKSAAYDGRYLQLDISESVNVVGNSSTLSWTLTSTGGASTYTDEGISGTNTKKREGFNQMIEDALAGKIDLIVTKSVSRFARNTVDSLVTVRKLKEKGVEVYFEKENIYTLDSKGELLITIMSSLAQEESRSISENVTWGQRKRFSDGKIMLAYKRFLGYKKGADGIPEIVEEEAKTVREIYDLFLSGLTPAGIAKQLTANDVPTPGGGEMWRASTILSILQNEKYKGSALLQKKFTTDFLTKKQKINEGEVPQYYIENSHPAIIDPQIWELTQIEIDRRRAIGKGSNEKEQIKISRVEKNGSGYFLCDVKGIVKFRTANPVAGGFSALYGIWEPLICLANRRKSLKHRPKTAFRLPKQRKRTPISC